MVGGNWIKYYEGMNWMIEFSLIDLILHHQGLGEWPLDDQRGNFIHNDASDSLPSIEIL